MTKSTSTSKAGDGGRGCLAFRREKFVPRGGPSGGDGGHGGSVYVVASPHTNTLINFRFHPEFDAERGEHGMGSNCTGHGGEDLELAVPIGTLVYEKTGDPDEPLAPARRSRRRRRSACSSPRAAAAAWATRASRPPPTARRARCSRASPAKIKDLRLELKLLADVGLVGFPNAGKSTLIARISAARPKIADYPFTTLTPNLGVVGSSGDRSFVVADVPGLIEGAHRGQGLGHQFLRHLERTKVLVHLVDVSGATGRDPVEDLDTVRKELRAVPADARGQAADRRGNKMDAVDPIERGRRRRARARARPSSACRSSASPASAARACPSCSKRCGGHCAARTRAEHAPAGPTPA